MTSENNRRIAKNTLMLYFRMLLTMGVSLYTVRVVLNTLGTSDYGIYNVVGGIVIMFSFLSSTMAGASQRFFAFEIGRQDYKQLKKTFSITMTIYIMIAIVILFLAETLGLWFLNSKMTIPDDRIDAARWVYQFSILSFMMTMFTIPYNAAIIAHEKMNIYAWVSIVEVTLKLLIVYLLVLFSFDKLKLYSVLIFIVTTFVTMIYRAYCKRRFDECRFSFYWEGSLFKEIISYSGWNLIGSLVGIMRNQGISILINLFFNPIVNAAQAIAFRINSTLLNFTNNFYIAVKPQIIKSYSKNDTKELEKLIISSSKYSYFLILILSLPLLFETDYILKLWLKDFPEFTVIFTRIIILNTLIEVINSPIITAVQATGNIKAYQAVVAVTQVLIIPFSYIFYKFGFSPQVSYIIMIILTLVSLLPRLFIFQKVTKLSAINYVKNVFPQILTVSSILSIFLLFIYLSVMDGFFRFFSILLCDILISPIVIYYIGLTKKEKSYILNILRQRILFRK